MIASLLVVSLVAAHPLAPLPVPAPSLTPEMKLTRAPSAAVQSLRISLQLNDPPGLDALIAAQRDPESPLYRHWLSPADFGTRFGRTAAEYQRLVEALTQAGLQTKSFHNRLYLEADGSVQQVEKLLGITLVDVVERGQAFRSFRGTPKLPANLASMMLAVGGLDTRPRFARRLLANGSNTMGPQDLRRFYDVEALHAQGYAGQLSQVALVGTIPTAAGEPSLDDVRYFYAAVSDSSATPVLDVLSLGSSQADPEQDVNIEEEMDMEMPTMAAPLLKSVTMVQAPIDTLFTSGFNEINENLSGITAVSTSFGACEPVVADGGLLGDVSATANAVAQGVSEGIAFFASAGDYGADDCAGFGGVTTATVDFPANVPYLIGVGGTMYTGPFDANGGVTAHADETTWNEDAGFAVVGGGGGTSTLFAQPAYQRAPGTNDGGGREVPDIALLASILPGVAIVDTLAGQIDNDGDGTSDASPMAAGMFALVNDYIGGCRLGSPAPELYALGRIQYGGGTSVFYDITTGNNSVGGATGFVAGPGYDEATGLGSIDVAALAGAWPRCWPTPPPGVDGGPNPDAGEVAYPDGGLELRWPGGYALDAGPRSPYSPCLAIACDGGTFCAGFTEGPAQCTRSCEPSNPSTCSAENSCVVTDAGPACSSGCPLGLASCQVPCNPAAPLSCGAGYYCGAIGDGGMGACVPGCATAVDCPAGSLCYDSTCLPGCDALDAGSCPVESFCFPVDAGAGVCYPGCVVAENCGPSGLCLFNQCQQTCATAAEGACQTNFFCAGFGDGGGTCQYGCASASDCSTGEICVDGTCGPACDPQSANTCGAGYFCEGADAGVGVCTYGCGTTSDCTGGDVCVTCDHTCTTPISTPGAAGAACASAAECALDQYCFPVDAGFPAGFCYAYCYDDCGCAPGSACLNASNYCAVSCSVNAGGPCRAGYACDPVDSTDNGLCLPACVHDSDCAAIGDLGTCDVAAGGVCVPSGLPPPTLSAASSSGSSSGSSLSSSSSGGRAPSSTSSSGSSQPSVTTGTTGTASGSSSGHPSSTTAGSSTGSASVHGSGASSATASVGSTGSSSSASGKGGCGCGAGSGPEALWVLLGMAGMGARRKRLHPEAARQL